MAENHNILGAFAQMDSGAIVVRQERCARVRNRNVECMKCAAACTSGCITYTDGQLLIDSTLCVGCGTCATVCPTCALEARNPSDGELVGECVRAARDGEVVIACSLLARALDGWYDKDAVVCVVCAGRVEESVVVELAAKGIAVRMVCGNCTQCAQEHGLSTALMVAESANALLEAWGSEISCEVSHVLPEYVLTGDADKAKETVEAFFAEKRACEPVNAKDDVTSAEVPDDKDGEPASAIPPMLRVMKDGTLPHFVPDRRARLLSALTALGEPQTDNLKSRLWGCVVINGMMCTSCRMCATFCPTGAISKFDEADGTFGVVHYPGDCVKCGSCRDICPAHAIVLLDDVKPSYILDGAAHRYTMKERAVTLNDPHQILNTMRERMKGNDIFER